MTQPHNPCDTDIELDVQDFELCDLKLLFCGHEKCKPGHRWGPDMRGHYVFHLVLSGKGRLNTGGKEFRLGGRQGFLLFPETQVHYMADETDPWEYIWVGFTGQSVPRMIAKTTLSPSLPVIGFEQRFERQRDLLRQIIATAKTGGADNIIESYGLFLQFVSNLAREGEKHRQGAGAEAPKLSTEQYVERAKDYIRENISRDITTSDVAEHLGLNRSYFYKIFTEACGKAPSRFITWQRLNTAWHLLNYTNMQISEISRHVGYNDPTYFTRCFTACYGQPPVAVRNADKR